MHNAQEMAKNYILVNGNCGCTRTRTRTHYFVLSTRKHRDDHLDSVEENRKKQVERFCTRNKYEKLQVPHQLKRIIKNKSPINSLLDSLIIRWRRKKKLQSIKMGFKWKANPIDSTDLRDLSSFLHFDSFGFQSQIAISISNSILLKMLERNSLWQRRK